ncbi:MAG TPA: hypothetical protein VIF57_14765 [Polyangia bacterium]
MRYHFVVTQDQPPTPGPNAAEIKALLESLKTGLDAALVGIFDGARAWLHASSESSPGAFWAALQDMPCLQTDWGEWDRELLESAHARVDCRCASHRLEAFMFHRRWILIVAAAGPLVGGADKVIAHAIEILKRLLPAARAGRSSPAPAGGGSGGGSQGPAELGIPVWWIRGWPSG